MFFEGHTNSTGGKNDACLHSYGNGFQPFGRVEPQGCIRVARGAPVYISAQKSQSPFPRPLMHRAAHITVSIALGHASANAVKATARGWSTGSFASLTIPLHSHMSSAKREGSEYHS